MKGHQGDVKTGLDRDHHWGGGGGEDSPALDSLSSGELGGDLLTPSLGVGSDTAVRARIEDSEERLAEFQLSVGTLTRRIDSLETELASTKCDAFLGSLAKETEHSGLCKVSKAGFKNMVFSGSGASTRSSAKLRAPDYSVDNTRWQKAVDHWKEVSYTFAASDSPTISFSLNTHNPLTEDTIVSAAIHDDQTYRWPVLDFFARKLLKAPEGLV